MVIPSESGLTEASKGMTSGKRLLSAATSLPRKADLREPSISGSHTSDLGMAHAPEPRESQAGRPAVARVPCSAIRSGAVAIGQTFGARPRLAEQHANPLKGLSPSAQQWHLQPIEAIVLWLKLVRCRWWGALSRVTVLRWCQGGSQVSSRGGWNTCLMHTASRPSPRARKTSSVLPDSPPRMGSL